MISISALNDISYIGLVFYTSLLLSLVLVPLSNRLAVWLGVLDEPDGRKVQPVLCAAHGWGGAADLFLVCRQGAAAGEAGTGYRKGNGSTVS